MKVSELGHVVLFVSNLERSRHFYGQILGWPEIQSPRPGGAAMFSTGRTHHELLLLEVGREATPIPSGKRLGMYHVGIKIGTTDGELRDAVDQLRNEGVRIVGSADHGVTHSVYVLDPDGNEIEIYIDVQPELWRENPEAAAAPTKQLVL